MSLYFPDRKCSTLLRVRRKQQTLNNDDPCSFGIIKDEFIIVNLGCTPILLSALQNCMRWGWCVCLLGWDWLADINNHYRSSPS